MSTLKYRIHREIHGPLVIDFCIVNWHGSRQKIQVSAGMFLKVHKNENFFGFDFEFCPISLLVMHK